MTAPAGERDPVTISALNRGETRLRDWGAVRVHIVPGAGLDRDSICPPSIPRPRGPWDCFAQVWTESGRKDRKRRCEDFRTVQEKPPSGVSRNLRALCLQRRTANKPCASWQEPSRDQQL